MTANSNSNSCAWKANKKKWPPNKYFVPFSTLRVKTGNTLTRQADSSEFACLLCPICSHTVMSRTSAEVCRILGGVSPGGISLSSYKYDIALSFAGEQRTEVSEVARHLTAAGVTVFYDEYQKADLWGKDLYQHLSKVYSKEAQYTMIFSSKEYADKIWTSHEL